MSSRFYIAHKLRHNLAMDRHYLMASVARYLGMDRVRGTDCDRLGDRVG